MKRQTLTDKATTALRRAVSKVIAERRKNGEPIAIWKDGKAIWEYPDGPEISVREKPVPYGHK